MKTLKEIAKDTATKAWQRTKAAKPAPHTSTALSAHIDYEVGKINAAYAADLWCAKLNKALAICREKGEHAQLGVRHESVPRTCMEVGTGFVWHRLDVSHTYSNEGLDAAAAAWRLTDVLYLYGMYGGHTSIETPYDVMAGCNKVILSKMLKLPLPAKAGSSNSSLMAGSSGAPAGA